MDYKKEVVEIFRGADESFIARIIESVSQDPYDLTGKTLSGFITGCPSNLELEASDFEQTQPILGKVRVKLSATKTALLKPGMASLMIIITEGGQTKKAWFENYLNVRG